MTIASDSGAAERLLNGPVPWRCWFGFIIGLAVCLAASLTLPFDSYVAWQQAAGSQMFHSRWIYERLHFDPSPIEVAIIGSSRLEAGISPRVLEKRLTEKLRRSVGVANLSMVMPGRDLADKITEELLATHPEVRLILLSDDGEITNSHPLYKETASARELWNAPLLVNLHYIPNLLALPYRNMANFAEHWRPAWFGIQGRFRVDTYYGAGLDRTEGYRTPAGEKVNGNIRRPASELARMSLIAVTRQREGLALLRYLPPSQRLAIDRRYISSIAERAARAHVGVAFAALPFYGPVQPVGTSGFYRRIGPVIALDELSGEAAYYQSAAHLNHSGAVIASLRLADAIAPLLGRMPPGRHTVGSRTSRGGEGRS